MAGMTPKYFHLLPPGEWERLCDAKTTWQGLQDLGYRQPDWCSYPDALDGLMGCWSLIYQRVTGEEYCKDCECCKSKDIP